jgi:hypothetical protein
MISPRFCIAGRRWCCRSSTPSAFRGLHLTYLDLAQPKGKLQLADPDEPGKLLDAKKSRGSKQGNRVELIGPRAPRRLVLGEGAEKVIAVWQALDDRALAGELPIGASARSNGVLVGLRSRQSRRQAPIACGIRRLNMRAAARARRRRRAGPRRAGDRHSR